MAATRGMGALVSRAPRWLWGVREGLRWGGVRLASCPKLARGGEGCLDGRRGWYGTSGGMSLLGPKVLEGGRAQCLGIVRPAMAFWCREGGRLFLLTWRALYQVHGGWRRVWRW